VYYGVGDLCFFIWVLCRIFGLCVCILGVVNKCRYVCMRYNLLGSVCSLLSLFGCAFVRLRFLFWYCMFDGAGVCVVTYLCVFVLM